jgi:hypothetical protein
MSYNWQRAPYLWERYPVAFVSLGVIGAIALLAAWAIA